jgi:hypothetical protein
MSSNTIKYIKSVSIGFSGMLFLGGLSCTKKFDEINTPENQIVASKIDATLLGQAFAQALFYGLNGDNQAFQRSHSLFSDEYAQYFATVESNFDSGNFTEVTSWTNRYFNDVYSRAAPQLLFVENYTKEKGMALANAIAKVWRVEMYHRISDFFGPIIYSQFGNGKTSVSYDSQEAVYKDFFKTLDEAAAVLKQEAGKNAFGNDDLVFGGSADKWLKFANSLRLRLAMRIVYVEPALAKAEAEKAVAAGVMTSNADNAMVKTTINNLNFYAAITYIDEFRMSATMQSVLTGYNDPRIVEYFEEAEVGGGYKGIRNGLPRVEKGAFLEPLHSFIDIKWRPLARGGTNPPLRVMAASELYFLRAEGALRGWNMGGTAKDLYNDGIRTSITEYTKASSAVIDSYIVSTATPVALNDKWNTPAMSNIPIKYDEGGNFELNLEQIITQKWIALFPDSWEAWSERRRTGYPKGLPIIESFNPNIPVTGMMRRLKFTTGEIASNNAAVIEARKMLKGSDDNHTRLWWDAKP